MKGATAEPWLKTISIPKIDKIKKIGRSQYFLRILINRQISKKILIILKLIFHTLCVCFFILPITIFIFI